MGLLDRFTGTQYPDGGAAPLSAPEVREALLAINSPDKPYVVRTARPAEKADLVAEWRVLEPAWRTFFLTSRLDRTLKTRMRLVPGKHEVRALDEQLEVTWVGDTPRLATSAEYSRGQVTTVSKRWTIERGPDGRRHMVEDFSFDTQEMKVPLQKAVLGAGWTWRGVLFRL
ncbi:hypothetical protein AB0I68_01130 [Streptomyces sp. NPDC050448]|uniref:hypothetical protein n=1 Tax=Streptomyces sp. NPDC050448 TaxID=3155404 RepID=UPI00343F3052